MIPWTNKPVQQGLRVKDEYIKINYIFYDLIINKVKWNLKSRTVPFAI